MVISHLLAHGLFFTFVVNSYLFVLMVAASPVFELSGDDKKKRRTGLA